MRASPGIESRSGLTLIEVLVSTSIVLAIVAMLSAVFNEIGRAWQHGEGRSERRRSARILADFIASELQGALLPVGTLSSKPTHGNLQLLINPPSSQVPDDYRNADTIFWQAPIATETSYGEVAEVGYFVKWLRTDAAPAPRPVLCRFFVNPSAPDPSGIPMPNPDFRIYDTADPDSWLDQGLLDKVAPADKKSGYVGLFAENVVGLWVRCSALDGVELPKVFDSRKGYALTANEQRYLPASVTVSVAQLDSRLAGRMDAVWENVRGITREAGINDAADFVRRMQSEAETNPALRPLLGGLRVYTTQVQLINGR